MADSHASALGNAAANPAVKTSCKSVVMELHDSEPFLFSSTSESFAFDAFGSCN
jgi:hypothetical protein